MVRGRRVGIAAAIVLAVFAAYEITTSFLAYTGDAYVESDLVSVAPQVTGRIIDVHVSDNQDVVRSDLLATIDPVPFQLMVDQGRAEAAEARAQIASDQYRIASAQDALVAAISAANYARETQTRVTTLATSQDVALAELDQANDALRRANAARDVAKEAVALAQSTLSMHEAAEARATAVLARDGQRYARVPAHEDSR